MVVYKAQNTVNGKCYIGLTTQSFEQRKREHYARLQRGERNHKFYQALRKHGFDSFTWEILATCSSLDELVATEKHHIMMHDSFRKGYNMNEGGTAISEETKAKLSAIHKGRIMTWGQKTKATRIANGGYYAGNKHHNWGHFGADATRKQEYIVTEPDGTEHHVIGMRHFCRTWTKDKLTHSSLIGVAAGLYRQYKGYRCRYVSEPSTTSPEGRTLQAIGSGNGEHP